MSNSLPSTWAIVSLLDVAPLVPTGVPNFTGEVEYYSTGSVQEGGLSSEGRYTFESRPSRANRWTKPGDVLQARMQGTSKPLLVNASIADKLFSTGFIQLRPDPRFCNPGFLRHYIASKVFLDDRDSLATGSTQIALTDAGVRGLEIPLAPLNEQRRIAAKLDILLGKVDECQKRLAKIPMILKRFRQAVLAAACSGRLTADWREKNQTEDVLEGSELPPGWHWMPIKELLPPGGIFDGPFGSNLKTADYTDYGVRVVRLENVGYLQFIHQKETYISQEKYKILSKHTVGAGDIIFASFIAEEVRACVLPKLKTRAIAKADCFCLRPRQEVVNSHYLAFQLVNRESYERLLESIHGATRPRINTTQLRNLEIRICPLAEQQEIVHRVEALFKLADSNEKRVAAASIRVEKLTQAILPKAFRGELVPTEAELARREGRAYETASELLTRIKSDKEMNEISVKLHYKLDHKKRSKPR